MEKLLNKKFLIAAVLCLIAFFPALFFSSSLRQKNPISDEAGTNLNEFPIPKNNIQDFGISASSFLLVFVSSVGNEKILAEKNKDKQYPIASITKLMTALVASEEYRDKDIISISDNALKDKGLSGIYKFGDSLLFKDALNALLVGSHNEVASSMAEKFGTDKFRDAMNQKAKDIGLSNTSFFNVMGLDPGVGSEEINHSTAYDVYGLMRYMEENHSDIVSITTQKEFKLFGADGKFITSINSTDKLLGDKNVPFRILGGKTGETPRAKQNLVIVSDSPCAGKIFSAILGSENSFEDMRSLMWYVNDSYEWVCVVRPN